ncbi:hypothetical protein [Actinomadura rupiterrae]|uniref:hypothetical protein n=1 Tax=Actinomadura rupiterrae TaxID=559627 RepID=UPI0020A25072|nr:hypothetical protein [Actinomadura rupiterrae]MCP2338691.1 hypothetical protein [Actinomadura rupiterrae]
MSTSPNKRVGRVLIVGRSPGVLVEAVDILRARGYSADGTNQFDQVLDDYDVTGLDLLVIGGMVPTETKRRLRADVSERNPGVTIIQGLSGIAGLLAAQVQEVDSTEPLEADYDAAHRSVRLTLDAPADVTIDTWFGTFTPPEPKSTTLRIFDGRLDAGSHIIPLPDQVPSEASFGAVTVGPSTRTFTIGAMPESVTRLVPTTSTDTRLPQVTPITTTTNRL